MIWFDSFLNVAMQPLRYRTHDAMGCINYYELGTYLESYLKKVNFIFNIGARCMYLLENAVTYNIYTV